MVEKLQVARRSRIGKAPRPAGVSGPKLTPSNLSSMSQIAHELRIGRSVCSMVWYAASGLSAELQSLTGPREAESLSSVSHDVLYEANTV